MANDRTMTVCSACLRVSCWTLDFPCAEYRSAGTVERTADELLALNREHPSHFDTEMDKASR